MVLVAHVGAGAGEDIRVELRLRRAVDVDTAREDSAGASAAVRTAADGLVLDVDGAVRAGQARGWEVWIPPYIAADGVEVSPQHLVRHRSERGRELGRGRCGNGPWRHVELADGDCLCFSGQRMAGGDLEES